MKTLEKVSPAHIQVCGGIGTHRAVFLGDVSVFLAVVSQKILSIPEIF